MPTIKKIKLIRPTIATISKITVKPKYSQPQAVMRPQRRFDDVDALDDALDVVLGSEQEGELEDELVGKGDK